MPSQELIQETPAQDPLQREWWEYRLFQPKTVDNETVERELQQVRDFFDFVSNKDSRLKAMTVIGSTLKGESKQNTERSSDIDLAVMYSFGKRDDARSIRSILYEFLDEFEAERKRQGLPFFYMQFVMIGDASEMTKENLTESQFGQVAGRHWNAIEGLFYPGLGDVERYRQEFRSYTEGLLPEVKEKIINQIINWVQENFQRNYAVKRGLISAGEEKEYIESRRRLIYERAHRIFG